MFIQINRSFLEMLQNSTEEERRFVYSDIGRAFLSIKRTQEMKKITVFYIQQYGLVL